MKTIIHQFRETGEVRQPLIKDGVGEWFLCNDKFIQQFRVGVENELVYKCEYPIFFYKRIEEEESNLDRIDFVKFVQDWIRNNSYETEKGKLAKEKLKKIKEILE